MLLLFRLIRVQ